MKLTTLPLLALFVFFTQLSYSQDKEKLSLKNGTINEQFDYIYKKSSKHKKYKVIKQIWFMQLKSHVNDSIKSLKSDLKEAKLEIKTQKTAFDTLQVEFDGVNSKLTTTANEKDSISFFGMLLKKSVYKTLMWVLIGLLAAALLFFIFRFKSSNETTKKALRDLEEVEAEFADSKTRALEREQVLNRRLQDELNKLKKS